MRTRREWGGSMGEKQQRTDRRREDLFSEAYMSSLNSQVLAFCSA